MEFPEGVSRWQRMTSAGFLPWGTQHLGVEPEGRGHWGRLQFGGGGGAVGKGFVCFRT